MKKTIILLLVAVAIVAGCKKETPKPETLTPVQAQSSSVKK